jgi:hypothetical protein
VRLAVCCLGAGPGERAVLWTELPVNRSLLVARLVFRSDDVFVHDVAVLLGDLLLPELEGQLGDLTGKVERHLVIVVVHWRASVHADVEGLVYRHEERNGVRDLAAGYNLVVHL